MPGYRAQTKGGIPMKNRNILLIAAIVCGAWVLLPDPLPVAVDDIIAGILCGLGVYKLIKTEDPA